ncbi:MAG TPA: DUF4286 family protein [Chloroflexota bacterium]|jgi:hypothetical protein|nr:DUF4286 family protein [Chloroflexota bacterium]
MPDPAKPAKGLLLVMMEVDPAFEEEFNRWYNEEHLPERLGCPGFLSARRFRIVEGTPKYLALYELESPDVLQSEAYLELRNPDTPWTLRVFEHLTTNIRNVYEEITPPASSPR